MSQSQAIPSSQHTAPTPVNSLATPSSLAKGSQKPSVAQIGEEDEGANPASLLAQNPNLFAGMDFGGAEGSGFVSSLPQEVRTRVEGLKGIQQQHAQIESEFQLEILALEKKFAERYAPLYERRKQIVAGSIEPTEDEVTAGLAVDDEEPSASIEEVDGDEKTKGIPDFWLIALRNHMGISELITEQDEEALHALTDIKLSYLEGTTPGFKITFSFNTNDFFSNAELEKTYYYRSEVGYGGDLMYERAEGTTIEWKEEKDLTKRTEIKKQRNKTTNRTRVVKKVIAADSFFNFFSPPTPPTEEALESGEFDDEDLAALDERLELDYQIGEDLKEKIIPRAVDFFTGAAMQDMDEDDEFSDEDDEFDEDEDDDDFASRQQAAAPGTSQDPQECKQQ